MPLVDKRTDTPGFNTQYAQKGNGGFEDYSHPVIASTERITRDSTNTPKGWVGPLPIHYFKFTKLKYNAETGHDYRVYADPREWSSFSSGCNGSNSGTESGIDYDKLSANLAIANNKLLNKVKNTSVNLGVIIGERKQTANLIYTTVVRLTGAMRDLRKGKFLDAAKKLGAGVPKRANSRFNATYKRDPEQAVASGWLELQYGWKPLLSDIYGACDALARRYQDPMVTRVSVKVGGDPPIPDKISRVTAGGVTSVDIHSVKRKNVVRTGVTFRSTKSSLQTAKELGLTNPLLVAWELVPFSFVVDWFLPIGTMLETLDATLGVEFISGYRTSFVTMTETNRRLASGRDNYGAQIDVDWISSVEFVSVERVPLGGFPTPSLPRFKDPFSPTHIANAVALVTSIFGGRFGRK